MTDKIINQAIRKRKAQERLGSQNSKCAICDEKDPHRLEAHHIAQHHNDEATVFLCKNHHATVTNLQKDHPVPTSEPISPERFGHMLLGLADLLALVIEKLVEIGEWLIKEAKQSVENKNSQQT